MYLKSSPVNYALSRTLQSIITCHVCWHRRQKEKKDIVPIYYKSIILIIIICISVLNIITYQRKVMINVKIQDNNYLESTQVALGFVP